MTVEERVYGWIDQVCAPTSDQLDTTATNEGDSNTMTTRHGSNSSNKQQQQKPQDKFQRFETWLRENGAVFDSVRILEWYRIRLVINDAPVKCINICH